MIAEGLIEMRLERQPRGRPVTRYFGAGGVILPVILLVLLVGVLGMFGFNFIVVLPLMIIFVTGLQFGGGFESRVSANSSAAPSSMSSTQLSSS